MSFSQLSPKRTKILVAMVSVGLMGGVLLAVVTYRAEISKTSSWHSVVPGQTKLSDSEHQLGMPDRIDERAGYGVHLYQARSDLQWEQVELWYKHDNADPTIVAVYKDSPYDRLAKPFTLGDYIRRYGQPNRVLWSFDCRTRYLIWANQGIAGQFSSNPVMLSEWDKLPVYNDLIFQPTAVSDFLTTHWPWPDYSSYYAVRNLCAGGDVPDELPQDPYDWSRMPTNASSR